MISHIYIPSHGRPYRQPTVEALQAAGVQNFSVVVNDLDEAASYASSGLVPHDHILVSNTKGIGPARKWIHDQVPMGSWYLQLDDNLERLTAVTDEYYDLAKLDVPVWDKPVWKTKAQGELNPEQRRTLMNHFATIYDAPVNATQFLELLDDTIAECERRGVHLAGLATTNNPLFRHRKFNSGFVIGKCMLIHKEPLCHWNTNCVMKEDYQFTAEHLLHYGATLRNHYLRGVSQWYQPGGCGPYEQRTELYRAASQFLMETYPGLFRYSSKTHSPEGTEVRIISANAIAKWRASHHRTIADSVVPQVAAAEDRSTQEHEVIVAEEHVSMTSK